MTRQESWPRAFRFARGAMGAILGAGALASCAGPRLEAVASPTQSALSLNQGGIHLALSPNTWNGYPSDLSRHYTPVQVHLENDRSDEIQVRYADFLAVDDAGNQYRAVPPAEVVRALYGSRAPDENRAWAQARWARPGAGLYVFHGPRWWYPSWPYYPYGSPFYSPFYPHPFYDLDYPYGWPRATSYDLLTRGLREGRVLPGARVEGFLFLQQATRTGNLLTFSWTPVTADGKPLPAFTAQFRIVR
ncbi:MAG TPA: hypothetical protein VLT62_20045 [Candidatus Methylomirabilis sp.]|nr:hypothetical protein [Candidatus Methylomirabilis sp.]HSB77913.1 hypothetical protein [Candidatus Methylomirabilis sp.]